MVICILFGVVIKLLEIEYFFGGNFLRIWYIFLGCNFIVGKFVIKFIKFWFIIYLCVYDLFWICLDNFLLLK